MRVGSLKGRLQNRILALLGVPERIRVLSL